MSLCKDCVTVPDADWRERAGLHDGCMAATTDLTDYYARRAHEYERIYAKPERQTDLAGLRLRLGELCNGRAVYEVACGTGYWTQTIATRARSVFATDINESVLDGSEHEVLKNFPDEHTLVRQLDSYAHSVRYEQSPYYWLVWGEVR